MMGIPIAVVLAATLLQSDAALVFSRTVSCCEGGFTKLSATAMAHKVVRGRTEPVRIALLTDDKSDQGRAGWSHMTYEQLRDRWRGEVGNTSRLALFLETPDGAGIEFIDRIDGTFERKIIKGNNPFRLSDSVDLLGVIERPLFVHVLCVSRDFRDADKDEGILRHLAAWFPMRDVILTIGEVPTYWDVLFHLPLTPTIAWSWAPEKQPPSRTRQLRKNR